MRAHSLFFGLFLVTAVVLTGCGDDTQVSGLPGEDVTSDIAIAANVTETADVPTDVATDIAAEVTVSAVGGQCQACDSEAECDEAFDCIALLNGSYCINRCQSATDCSSKFTCDKADSKDSLLHCLPPNYSCAGCLATGCGGDQVCDPSSGQCVAGKPPCTPCKKASDCGPGLKCATLASPDFSTQTICMPECTSNGGCQPGSLCQKTDAGNVCGFTGLACCYGAKCQPDAGCSQCPGKCILGACVQCLLDKECPGGHCDTTSHQCVNTVGCPAEKPVKLSDGTCAQCGQNSDCKPGKVCDTGHKCIAEPTICKACNEPSPDCAQVLGEWTCVACTSDATCAAAGTGTCDLKTFACVP